MVTGKLINQGDWKGMKVPSSLHFIAEEKYIIVLKDTLETLYSM